MKNKISYLKHLLGVSFNIPLFSSKENRAFLFQKSTKIGGNYMFFGW